MVYVFQVTLNINNMITDANKITSTISSISQRIYEKVNLEFLSNILSSLNSDVLENNKIEYHLNDGVKLEFFIFNGADYPNITLVIDDAYLEINIDEYFYGYSYVEFDKIKQIVKAVFNSNYKIIDYYKENKQLYSEILWIDSLSMCNKKSNSILVYPFLLSKKEELKKENKLEGKIRYPKLPLTTATDQST